MALHTSGCPRRDCPRTKSAIRIKIRGRKVCFAGFPMLERFADNHGGAPEQPYVKLLGGKASMDSWECAGIKACPLVMELAQTPHTEVKGDMIEYKKPWSGTRIAFQGVPLTSLNRRNQSRGNYARRTRQGVSLLQMQSQWLYRKANACTQHV
jgi:hypothetical protein